MRAPDPPRPPGTARDRDPVRRAPDPCGTAPLSRRNGTSLNCCKALCWLLASGSVRKVPFAQSLRIIGRGSLNWIAKRPIVVSFEVTDSCTCWCKHCDHGGPRDESRNLKPADYRRYVDDLQPCVVQVSGGEPLMRDDVVEIV